MGRRSSDSEDDSRGKRKRKQRRHSSSSSSSSSSSGSRVTSSRSRRSSRRSRSRDRERDRDRNRDRRRRRHSSSSSSHSSSRRRRSRSADRDKGRSHRSHRSRSRDRRSHSHRRRTRSRSHSRRRSRSHSRDRSRRMGRDREKEREKDRVRDKDKNRRKDKGEKRGDPGSIKSKGLEHLTPSEQAKVRMQLVLQAAAKTDEALKAKVAKREEDARRKVQEEGTSLEDQVRRIKDIEAIESDSFVPQAFKSSRDQIKVEVKQETEKTLSQDISLPVSTVYNDSDTLAHPNLFMDKDKAEELWINRLISLRQERLLGSPVT